MVISRVVLAAVVVGALVGLGLGSYYGVRSLTDEGGAEAQRPSTVEINAALDADRAKPRLESEIINGISVGTEATQDSGYCDPETASPQFADPAAVKGTPLDIVSVDLPGAAAEGSSEVVECGGLIVSAFITYSLPDLLTVDVGRARFAAGVERSRVLYGSADRIEPITVDGKTGVMERPVVDGFDTTTIILNEEFGITIVQADLSVEETIRIAASVR